MSGESEKNEGQEWIRSTMVLLISIVLALLPLAGIVYIVSNGFFTVDALFMGLILLTVSGIFLLNAFLEARRRGLLPRKASPAEKGC